MDKDTILLLDQINQTFYQATAKSFDQSRQCAWSGWNQVLPIVHSLGLESVSVLDVGCGNGRFGEFLLQHHVALNYTGIDSNSELLRLAQLKLAQPKLAQQPLLSLSLRQLNLVKLLLDHQVQEQVSTKFNLIVGFGILHHIPSFQLRVKLITELGSLLQQNQSCLILTAWQFGRDARFANKTISPQSIGLDPEQLEPSDFLLDWQGDRQLARYCHYLDELEVKQVAQEIKSLQLSQEFLADGKTHDLNRYLVWTKKTKR